MPRTTHIVALLFVAIAASYVVPWHVQRRIDAVAEPTRATRAKLELSLPPLVYQNVAAGPAFHDLATRIGVPITLDPALTTVGFDEIEPIPHPIFSDCGRDALNSICLNLSSRHRAWIDWRVADDGSAIVIGVYPDRRRVDVAMYDLSALFPFLDHPDTRGHLKSNAEVQEDILKLCMETIAPDSWIDVGGEFAKCGFGPGYRLFVVQTPEAQRGIAALLELLLEQGHRFLAVPDGLIRPTRAIWQGRRP